MAEMVLTDAYFSINSVDLSDKVKSITLNYGAAMVDKTAMSATGLRRLSGLTDFSVTLEFNQDYVAGEVDATIFPLVGAAAVAIEIRPDSAAVGVTNPKFTGSVLVESYSPVSGSVGDLATAPVTLQGDGALTRATA